MPWNLFAFPALARAVQAPGVNQGKGRAITKSPKRKKRRRR